VEAGFGTQRGVVGDSQSPDWMETHETCFPHGGLGLDGSGYAHEHHGHVNLL
jgi:hypothetical protein